MTFGEITGTRTYLTFTLDQEDFAVDVVGVREVLDFTTVTRVPRTPDFMKGVINLRGSVVPVIDLRLKFGLPEAEKTVDTCVIVLEVELEGEVTVIGAIADSVKEVFELGSSDIEPPPRLGTRFDTEFISGMGKHNDGFIIILDVNRVFSSHDMELFRLAEDVPPQTLLDPHRPEEMPSKVQEDPVAETDAEVMEGTPGNDGSPGETSLKTRPEKKKGGPRSAPGRSGSGKVAKGTRKSGSPAPEKG